jgi:predicted nucleotidyltransferase
MDINPKYPEIVAREFRKAKKLADDVSIDVEFTDDETIIVSYPGERYVMTIGSDDDYFWFHNEKNDDVVSFDYPSDWIELEEDSQPFRDLRTRGDES